MQNIEMKCLRVDSGIIYDVKHVGLNPHVVLKIFGNGVKIAWNGQNREGAMCTLRAYVSMCDVHTSHRIT